jgi:signal transduction histidine kinase
MGFIRKIQDALRGLSLRSTLVLWNLGSAVLFVGICWVVLLFLGKSPGRDSEFFDPRFIERAAHTVQHAEPETIRETVQKLNVPRGTSAATFRRDQPPEIVLGDRVPQGLEGLDTAWRGKSNHRMVFQESFTLWLPVRSGDQVIAVVGFSFPGKMAPPTHWRNVVMAFQAGVPAMLFCLAVMIGLNRRLTTPLHELARATEYLGKSELDYRVRLKGPKEFSNLARAFNQMAAKLEQTLQDLNNEKQRVESIERSRREFLADMSHNLGTPLSAIQGWIRQLGQTPPNSEQSALLNKVERQVTFLSRTSSRLLDLSRWEHSSPEIFWQDFPVAEPLFEAVESVEEDALEKNVELRFEQVGHHRVRADLTRVRELFQIFLENAVRYSGPGTTVEVSTKVTGGQLHLTVRDDGKGIPQEEIPRLTERFCSSTSGGNGLGLAIAEQLCRALGGRLRIESTPGVGTTIRFQLRLSKSQT